MSRKDLQSFLDVEVGKWSAKPFGTLKQELRSGYENAGEGLEYHVEVQLLENRKDYIHVSVAVCSERVRWSCFHPLSTSFLVYPNGRVVK